MGTKTEHTVRDFKNDLLQRAGVNLIQFCGSSPKRAAFWEKLNDLGARNIKERPPETVPDIDATVALSDDEWFSLDCELQRLLQE